MIANPGCPSTSASNTINGVRYGLPERRPTCSRMPCAGIQPAHNRQKRLVTCRLNRASHCGSCMPLSNPSAIACDSASEADHPNLRGTGVTNVADRLTTTSLSSALVVALMDLGTNHQAGVSTSVGIEGICLMRMWYRLTVRKHREWAAVCILVDRQDERFRWTVQIIDILMAWPFCVDQWFDQIEHLY